jgi:hypothetical protein
MAEGTTGHTSETSFRGVIFQENAASVDFDFGTGRTWK